MADQINVARQAKESKKLKNQLKTDFIGFGFIAPWLIGFLGFIIGPMLASLYFSFTNYDLLTAPTWIGLENYINMFTNDDRFWKAIRVTFIFVFGSVPLKLAFALFVAMLFNNKRRGVGLYRTLYYVPSILGGSVAIAVVWKQLFGRDGAINEILSVFGIPSISWVTSPDFALSTLIILVVWQFGSPMLIFLAGLKAIPNELYEAASVDGANPFLQFIKITLPMLSPVIFFNLVMQTIQGFMAFTQSFLITEGGPMDNTLFYAVYLYEKAFAHFDMGYASALAWILLLICAVFTAFIFRTAKSWVYYESEGGN
ncbi:carbohydrate ABC transporter membrane protein 1, CUT1 family (TC 3.A.1.1.-) [Gracilibacillus ureilyticus]|uniref:Carbohydrate ABC transporter membrane protein 1, CUT1 family (TC 3.A.1.1.-) n=1 Tax=Gracilibacillus ureilyticus TaxID=531814 RepID=A0A1H9UKM6_9BACI|nr:sugar ABC transporter permease [Gracilibacillus ureilyticus]SES09848.1 carbohydrate ABC transporter membrane protein 1, CUT1 family (TC 3.A.1.1.-) [Gracilibacillus ureilyticus]